VTPLRHRKFYNLLDPKMTAEGTLGAPTCLIGVALLSIRIESARTFCFFPGRKNWGIFALKQGLHVLRER
jgi:hypothetical protein